MKGLTDKQRAMLDFIESFMEKENMAPTVYEIADSFDIKTSTVFAHLRALQRKNFLNRSSKARSISLLKPKRKPRHMSFVLPIPLLGRINAGLPAESLENKEGEVYCDPEVIGGADLKKIFALKINGESMRDLGILDGDVVIVKQTSDAKSGDVVVALVEDETTVKSYYPKGQKIELRPANSDFKPQIYPMGKVKIQGKVIALQRKY
jgi:repressor LexA